MLPVGCLNSMGQYKLISVFVVLFVHLFSVLQTRFRIPMETTVYFTYNANSN